MVLVSSRNCQYAFGRDNWGEEVFAVLCCCLSSVAVPPTLAGTRMKGSVATGKLNQWQFARILGPTFIISSIHHQSRRSQSIDKHGICKDVSLGCVFILFRSSLHLHSLSAAVAFFCLDFEGAYYTAVLTFSSLIW